MVGSGAVLGMRERGGAMDFVINHFFMKMFNTNDMHIVRNCQMYFNFDMLSTLWAKRVRTFNVRFSASNNMFCKATESNHAHLM